MKSNAIPARRSYGQRSHFSLYFSLSLIMLLVAATIFPQSHASSRVKQQSLPQSDFQIASGDTCAAATVINPASLPFTEDSTTAGAANDIDPGFGGCAEGPGPDVVYSFTPAATDIYTIGATPFGESFDLSLYVITDCANPTASCVGGAFDRPFAEGESLALTLTAGTRYFIVVDSRNFNGQGAFHFTLRRGRPANDSCATPTVIEANRLPFINSGTTTGATNDTNPGEPCLRINQSGNGPDVVYSFTPADTQNYDVTVTPVANYDVSVYIVTDCATAASCAGEDNEGNGDVETIRRNLTAGTTYFIIVDGKRQDSGDFTLTLVPSIPRAPQAPTELVAQAVSSTQINLTWNDNSGSEQGFRIERSLDGTNFTEIATVDPNTTAFSDTGLTPSTTYFYRVFAFNGFGNSDPSNIAADTTQAPPVPQFPVITLDPAIVDFGTVRATVAATRTVKITNDGATDLVISAISDPTGPFSILNRPQLPLTIESGESFDLSVRFLPPTQGQFTGSFTISSNAPLTPVVTVGLTGTATGFPVADLQINSNAVFNFTGGSSVSQIQITNTGDADLLISSIMFPSAPFFISGLPQLPATIAPGQSISFILSFSPTAPGVFQSSFTIVNNDPDSILLFIPLRGTSTPQNELLKLRAPVQFTAVIGQTNTINVLAVNGTNSDIRLSASAVPGGVFTDRGNGRGDLVLSPTGTERSTTQVMFTATDSASRTKSLVSSITIVPAGETFRVQIAFTPPEVASNPPTAVTAINQSFPLIASSGLAAQSEDFSPAVAPGLAGYVIYRSTVPGAAPALGNIVGVAPASATSFTDVFPTPATGAAVMPPFYYTVTALYSTGIESGASNQSSNEPRLTGLQFKKKRVRFLAANSNVEVGAVLVVDGTQTFTLVREGDFIQVNKNTRSTPGNLRVVDIFAPGSSHTVQVRNPHGPNSQVVTLTR